MAMQPIPSAAGRFFWRPFAWVAVELARTRITGFPWDLLGISQVDNIPLAHIATVTGVYGLSFEIMVVNTALAAAFVIRSERGQRSKRKPLLLATAAAIVVLQAGQIDQSAGSAHRPHRSPGAAEHSGPARQRLDERIF